MSKDKQKLANYLRHILEAIERIEWFTPICRIYIGR